MRSSTVKPNVGTINEVPKHTSISKVFNNHTARFFQERPYSSGFPLPNLLEAMHKDHRVTKKQKLHLPNTKGLRPNSFAF